MLDKFLATLTSPEVGGLLVTLSALMLADFVTGVGAAFKRKGEGLFGSSFEPLMVAEFLRTHVLGRLMGIVALVLFATIAEPLVVVVGLAVTAYGVETVASIKANLDLANEPSPDV